MGGFSLGKPGGVSGLWDGKQRRHTGMWVSWEPGRHFFGCDMVDVWDSSGKGKTLDLVCIQTGSS